MLYEIFLSVYYLCSPSVNSVYCMLTFHKVEEDKELCEMMSNLSSQDKEAEGEPKTLEERLGVSRDELNLLKVMDQLFAKEYEKVGGDPKELGGGLGILDCTIADDELFQSPPPRPDCPICCLTRPLLSFTYQPCCGKTLCDGCIYAHKKASKEYNCPFCRTPVSSSDKERIARTKKRMDCNESDAYVMLAMHHYQGTKDVKRDYGKAVELWKKAAELGPSDEGDLAHYYLGVMYANGHGVEKDEKKSMYHYRISSIGGNVNSRFNLGLIANESENAELAIKHLVIGAKAGHDESLAAIKKCYDQGFVQKDVFAEVLRVHKAANDEMKSVERDKAAKERASLGLTGRL